ncbi:MAG: hypothetical protein ACTSXE_04545, partial [Candidatus Thorarchaeota archaeon]
LDAKRRLEKQGVSSGEIHFTWKVDMRYSGQSHELSITLMQDTNDFTSTTIKAFEHLHKESFGYELEGRKVEWVTARVVAQFSYKEYEPYKHSITAVSIPVGERMVLLSNGETASANVFRRESLGVGQLIVGPSIIEQIDTTTYIAPEWTAEQRADGTLWLRRRNR